MVKEATFSSYPSAVATPSQLGIYTNNESVVLMADVTLNQIVWLVSDTANLELFSALALTNSAGAYEIIQIIDIDSNASTITVNRGMDGTTQRVHKKSQRLYVAPIAKYFNQIREEILAIENFIGVNGAVNFLKKDGSVESEGIQEFSLGLTTDSIYPYTIGSPISFFEVLKVNDIEERTGAHGVSIDGILIKDGGATFTGPLRFNNDTFIETDGDFNADLLPNANAVWNVGADVRRWSTLFGVNLDVYDALIQNDLTVDGDLDVIGRIKVGGITVIDSDRDYAVNLIPNVTGTQDIGSSSRYWKELFLNTMTLSGNATITGNLEVGGQFSMDTIPVFETDRDVAITLLPNATGTLDLGSSVRRWKDLFANTGNFSGNVTVSGDLEVAGAITMDTIPVFETDRDVAITLLPNATGTLDLGSSSRRWKDLYGNTANFTGNATVTGDLEVGGAITMDAVPVFETDRDVAITLLPNATGTLDLGSAGRRWLGLYANTGNFTGDVEIAGALTMDTIPVLDTNRDVAINLQPSATGTLDLGASTRRWKDFYANTGSFATSLAVTGTSTLQQTNPQTDNTYDLGTAALRWRTLYLIPSSLRVLNAASDAQPIISLTTGLNFGVGGATAVDVTLSRGAANRLDLASGDTLRIATDGSTGAIQLGATGDVNIFRGAADRMDLASGDTLRIATDGSTGSIQFGASGDVSLFRGAADRLDLATGDSLNIVSGTILVAGTQVITSRQAAVTAPTGGTTIDLESRTAINAIIARLQSHGLIT